MRWALLIALLAAHGGSHTATVRVKDIRFTPKAMTVKPGTRVTWQFDDEVVTHNVHSRGALRFASSRDLKVGTYSVTFRAPGVYRYHCTLHPGMRGRVTVQC